MFVIPCYHTEKHSYIVDLVQQIREFHPTEQIVVVDSDSPDKSYFDKVRKCDVSVLDIKNKHYHVGAYWAAYKFFQDDYYWFLHDTVKVKANLDHYKEKYFTALGYFGWSTGGDVAGSHLERHTPYRVPHHGGNAICGPIFGASRTLMDILYRDGVHKILPTHTAHTPNPPKDGIPNYAMEGMYGIIFESLGYHIPDYCMLGDMHKDGPAWMTGADTSWQFPIEKFYAKRA